MKKFLPALICLLILNDAWSQTFQATIQGIPLTPAADIIVRPSATITGKVSGITITIAIPASVGARPPITVNNSANPYIGYDVYDAIDQSINGTPHYIYNVLGTGDVTQPGASITFPGNTDIPIARINFNGTVLVSTQIKLVNLPNGGTDPNPNSFFGLSLDGTDIVNTNEIFYGIPSISTAVNDGLGYAGTSFAETIALVVLPVRFLSFTAIKRNDNGEFGWSVENESAITDRYEIQRSFNSSDFTTIANVVARNNGSSQNRYTGLDNNLSLLRPSGNIYYRIKQIDRNGTSVYSEIKMLSIKGSLVNVSIHPNPTADFSLINIHLTASERIAIRVLDQTGKVVSTTVINGVPGLNTYKAAFGRLAAGNYMVSVSSDSVNETIPVIKK